MANSVTPALLEYIGIIGYNCVYRKGYPVGWEATRWLGFLPYNWLPWDLECSRDYGRLVESVLFIYTCDMAVA